MATECCIDDLADFSGTLHELKQIVDYLYTNYGSNSHIYVEEEHSSVNFILLEETTH